jgi:DNA-directed RNA polymerase I subunit RPA2
MKCVREDLTSHTITLHYINDGNCLLRIIIRKQEFLIPAIIILKCFSESPDIFIYNKIIRGNSKNSKLKECVEVLIAEGHKYGFNKKAEYLKYLGCRFRDLLGLTQNQEVNDEEIGEIFLKEYILNHLEKEDEKFNIFCLMLEKLYLLAFGDIKPDNMDSSLNHEILLSGHLYSMVLKEKLEEVLLQLRIKLNKVFNGNRAVESEQVRNMEWLKKQIDGLVSIGKKMEHFLATGNLTSRTGLDLMQQGGFSIVAEKLNNMRYISHFRSVHRGQFFTTMKTTQPRKLLPEGWGFLCPVHTPDGSPCGLLLHISSGCQIISSPPNVDRKKFELSLSTFGMIPISNDLNLHIGDDTYPVILDGAIIGYVSDYLVRKFIDSLRKNKVYGSMNVPNNLEIGFIPKSIHSVSLQFPGIFLFTTASRMTRKVKNLNLNKEEYIGTLEQIYLDIACLPEDIRPETTHQELDPIRMLSLVASLTPFCDYNQSPRNMYQCQMAKQTMGTPYFNYPFRTDNKTYRILFPQSPMVRTTNYNDYGFDNYPSGTNAVVAVLSYTGYDMEDGMIVNKSSYERGLGHGTVYKTVSKMLNEVRKGQNKSKNMRYRLLDTHQFPDDKLLLKTLKTPYPDYLSPVDGLPAIGTKLEQNKIKFLYVDTLKNQIMTEFYKDQEPSYVDELRVYDNSSGTISVNFKFRYKRNPVIGDKFSSRHGQKGVLSNLWPQENMPFTEDGITPDIIINPHAFPSRMTIGMLIESLAGKSGSLHGKFQEFSAFHQFEDDDAIGYFGKELLSQGYNYLGNEVMYSGVSGLQLKADIYIGVVYYQRLRHMVNDKAQARALGPIDVLTRQPIKGRKNQGGIRFGEMERDSLLSHGTSFCLHDRLFNCSDYSEGYICKECGELLATLKYKHAENKTIISQSRQPLSLNTELEQGLKPNRFEQMKQEKDKFFLHQGVYCRSCNKENTCVRVAIPFVLRYMTNELAAMNIKLSFGIK